MAESLLPGTDALACATVEWARYRGRHLIRYRSVDGKVSYRRAFADDREAFNEFWGFADLLRRDMQRNVNLATKGGLMTCTDGTVASYAGSTCEHPGVVYSFPTLPGLFHSSGSIELHPEDVRIQQDRQGPNTLLIASDKFNITEGTIVLNLAWHVAGSNGYAGFLNGAEVTGDGHIQVTMTVKTPAPAVVISTPQEPKADARFDQGDYVVNLLIQMRAGPSGSATFKSYGTHFGVL